MVLFCEPGPHLCAPWPDWQVFGAKKWGRERNLSLGLGMVAAGCRRPDGLWEKNPPDVVCIFVEDEPGDQSDDQEGWNPDKKKYHELGTFKYSIYDGFFVMRGGEVGPFNQITFLTLIQFIQKEYRNWVNKRGSNYRDLIPAWYEK